MEVFVQCKPWLLKKKGTPVRSALYTYAGLFLVNT